MSRGKSQKSIELIEASRRILEEIQPASVRAVCYQLFNLKLIDSMSKNNTNRVGAQLTWARENGLIPWAWIVDETRARERTSTWTGVEAFADAVEGCYRRDRWEQQPRRIEVWSEKGTVRGTLAPVLDRYAVGFRVMHGYASATAVNEVAQETRAMAEPLLVLYVGDWDPSGLHMSEVDLPGRLREYGARVILRRVALTQADVADPTLPSFEAETKKGDPRWQWFTDRYGAQCWELDALSPVVLRQRVEDEIRAVIDWDAWDRAAVVEEVEQASLRDVMGNWRQALAARG